MSNAWDLKKPRAHHVGVLYCVSCQETISKNELRWALLFAEVVEHFGSIAGSDDPIFTHCLISNEDLSTGLIGDPFIHAISRLAGTRLPAQWIVHTHITMGPLIANDATLRQRVSLAIILAYTHTWPVSRLCLSQCTLKPGLLAKGGHIPATISCRYSLPCERPRR